ncbi:hypothetical protein PtB15_5B761 [Puccinia triticina]|nr:hypothetical protein PtB15_5B761 [Puccinia triticina]
MLTFKVVTLLGLFPSVSVFELPAVPLSSYGNQAASRQLDSSADLQCGLDINIWGQISPTVASGHANLCLQCRTTGPGVALSFSYVEALSTSISAYGVTESAAQILQASINYLRRLLKDALREEVPNIAGYARTTKAAAVRNLAACLGGASNRGVNMVTYQRQNASLHRASVPTDRFSAEPPAPHRHPSLLRRPAPASAPHTLPLLPSTLARAHSLPGKPLRPAPQRSATAVRPAPSKRTLTTSPPPPLSRLPTSPTPASAVTGASGLTVAGRMVEHDPARSRRETLSSVLRAVSQSGAGRARHPCPPSPGPSPRPVPPVNATPTPGPPSLAQEDEDEPGPARPPPGSHASGYISFASLNLRAPPSPPASLADDLPDALLPARSPAEPHPVALWLPHLPAPPAADPPLAVDLKT